MNAIPIEFSFPRLCGRLGANASTLGQAMHNAAFRALDLPFIYVAFTTTDTAAGIQAMRSLGFRGYSLTIPHKEAALPFIDKLSEEAKAIGAINTVINEDGLLRGENTDWFGVIESLREVQFEGTGKKALLFGASGASRAAVYALKLLGCAKVYITNRSDERAKALARSFNVEFLSYASLRSFDFSSIDLFINGSSIGLGLTENEQFPFSSGAFTRRHFVFDMVTEATELLRVAGSNGATLIPGTRMLLHQAYRQFYCFTGQEAPTAVMEAALKAEKLRLGLAKQ